MSENLVNHPKHYTQSGVECYDVVSGMTYPLGNITKYVWRREYKGTKQQDLNKAMWYLKRLDDEGCDPFQLQIPHANLYKLRVHIEEIRDTAEPAEVEFFEVLDRTAGRLYPVDIALLMDCVVRLGGEV